MSHKTNKFYKILSSPLFYSLFQKLMKGDKIRRKILTNAIKKKKAKILDIGCGLGDSLEHVKNPIYFGYDISEKYIKYARNKYKEKGIFFCKNFTYKEIKKLPKFDYVLLIGILHHLKNHEIVNLLKLTKKVLKTNGQIITLDPIYEKKQNFFARFLISKDRGKNIKTKKEYLNLLRLFFKHTISKTYRQFFIPYTWFTMSCKK